MEGFLNPIEVLKNLELKKDMIACDFGSGSGGWVIPLAKILEDGKVYAIDILEEPLSALKSKAKSENLLNIETMRADIEKGTPLASNSVDLILMTNLLFQVEDKKAVFKEAKRILKENGLVLVVDWQKKATIGPVEGRVGPEEIKKIAKELDFEAEKEFGAGLYHWGLIFKKR
jgi:ubiquinone/menaquinone biosynthesis C-methylase UbiE